MRKGLETGKSVSSTIYAPKELKERIRGLSEKLGRPQWKILLEALSFYETLVRKPKAKEELPTVDKVVWYIEKLCMSIGALKENPSDANLQKTLKTVSQVRERLGVDTSILEKAASDYVMTIRSLQQAPEESRGVFVELTTETKHRL